MNIAIDGLLLFPPFTGLQTTLVSHIQSLSASESHRIRVFVPNDFPAGKIGFNPSVDVFTTSFFGRKRIRRTLFRNFSMMRHSYRFKADLFHGPSYYLPAATSLPSVVTIHDVIALTHPDLVNRASRRLFKRTLPKTVTRATRIVTPTEVVKSQLVELMNVPPQKVDVVPWFVDIEPPEKMSKRARSALKKKMNLPEKYILFVGRLEKKKGISGIIQAFWALQMEKKRTQKLLIAGPVGNAVRDIEWTVRNHKATDYVAFSGYLDDSILQKVYQLADAVVLPSAAEGFGMTLLEAMAHGTPVICSDIPSLREVGGDAPTYVALNDMKGWRAEMVKVCDNPNAFQPNIEAGLERARMFNRESYVSSILSVYGKTIQEFRS